MTLCFASAGNDSPHRLQQAEPAHAGFAEHFHRESARAGADSPAPTPGPHDYRVLETRKDILTFEIEPLTEDLWVADDITAVIHASCDCRDFDLSVRLQDMHPDGAHSA